MNMKYTWLPADSPSSSSPIQIIKAKGSHLITKDGKKIYDAISSWWCKPLGHQHPIVVKSIIQQLSEFEHHIPAGAYNDKIEKLSSLLIEIFDDMSKVMYASDGSSAVEIAMKLSYESRLIEGQPNRKKFISLCGNYHGETIHTLGVCGIEDYRSIYHRLLADNYQFIDNICYVNSRFDPKWTNCNFNSSFYNDFFKKNADQATALIIEPIVQGAGGIKVISRDFLVQITHLAKKYGLHIISDEIMVGLGRLGCFSVSKEILDFEPDLVCFAKNLTAGSIPMSAIVINKSITNLFINSQKIFLHSHTHSCNSLGASVAINYLQHLQQTEILKNIQNLETRLFELALELSNEFKILANPRSIGAIIAWDLQLKPDLIKQIQRIAIEESIFLRPINNTLYLMPPLYELEKDLPEIISKTIAVLKRLDYLARSNEY